MQKVSGSRPAGVQQGKKCVRSRGNTEEKKIIGEKAARNEILSYS